METLFSVCQVLDKIEYRLHLHARIRWRFNRTPSPDSYMCLSISKVKTHKNR